MKDRVCYLLLIGMFSVCVAAQPSADIPTADELYQQGRDLFLKKQYSAAIPLLRNYVNQSASSAYLEEAEYMLVCVSYFWHDADCLKRLEAYLERYPDTPHATRLHAMTGSVYYYNGDYNAAIAMFSTIDLTRLSADERDEFTYQMALTYFSLGNLREAAAWLETVKQTSATHRRDCDFYIGYIRYDQGRYEEAKTVLQPLLENEKYGLQAHRIMGGIAYHEAAYDQSIREYDTYSARGGVLSRSDYYMLGMAYYQSADYSKAAEALGEVVGTSDELTQNAYLHLGLSYLKLNDKNKARMAFEQATALQTDPVVTEQAAYNYALCIHDTSFSAFGESVKVFEAFLNNYPHSVYADKISSYLVDVYLNTRSYDAALKSIERIREPSSRILEAKLNILFQLGVQAYTNMAYSNAVSYFNRAIEIGRYNKQTLADAYYWRGESYYRMNQMAEAARNFNDFLRLNVASNSNMKTLAYYNLGYTAFQQKEYRLALANFQRYTGMEKRTNAVPLADAYNRMGDCYLDAHNYEDAKAAYARAEALNVAGGDYAFYQLALVSGLQRDYSGKITILNRLIGKYPTSPYYANALYEKGRAYVMMDNNTQAIQVYDDLINRFPSNALARKAAAERGLLYYQNDQYDQAIAAYKLVVEKYPGSAEARLALRDLQSLYVDLNRVDEYTALVSTLPGNMRIEVSAQDSLTYAAAERVFARGQTEQARTSFEKYLETYPNGAYQLNAHYYLAKIAYTQKKWDMVLQHTEALVNFPDSPYAEEALLMRGEVQYALKQYSDALITYRQLLEKAGTTANRVTAKVGILRSAFLTDNNAATLAAADDLLAEGNLAPELVNEAMYCRAKANLREGNQEAAIPDLQTLAKDTRNSFGAEAKYQVANVMFAQKNYDGAEKELLNFIDVSTPHAYWLGRGFLLLSDVYAAKGDTLDARQYLLSLQQNYPIDNDGIKDMITTRLQKLKP